MTTEKSIYFPPEDIQALNETHPLPEGMKWVAHSRTYPVCVYSYPRSLYVAWVFIGREKQAVFAPRDYDPNADNDERIPVPSLEDGIELIYMRMLLGVDQPRRPTTSVTRYRNCLTSTGGTLQVMGNNEQRRIVGVRSTCTTASTGKTWRG